MSSVISFKKRLVIDINYISHLETRTNNNKAPLYFSIYMDNTTMIFIIGLLKRCCCFLHTTCTVLPIHGYCGIQSKIFYSVLYMIDSREMLSFVSPAFFLVCLVQL